MGKKELKGNKAWKTKNKDAQTRDKKVKHKKRENTIKNNKEKIIFIKRKKRKYT